MTLLFLDIETTGLKPDSHVLEVAYFLTDDQGGQLSEVKHWRPAYCPEARAQLEANPHVLGMHRANGLIAELELAYFLTDDQGKRLNTADRYLLPYCKEALEQLKANPHVLEMHRSSGLLERLEQPLNRSGRHSYELALHQIRHDLRELVSEQEDPKKVRLAGFSVHFDATILLAQWGLANWAEATGMSHRYMDVRVLVDAVKAATGIGCGPQGDAPHRAYQDCLSALESYKAALEVIRGRQ